MEKMFIWYIIGLVEYCMKLNSVQDIIYYFITRCAHSNHKYCLLLPIQPDTLTRHFNFPTNFMKTKPKTLAALSLSILIFTLLYFLYLSNNDQPQFHTEPQLEVSSAISPSEQHESSTDLTSLQDSNQPAVIKVTGKQKASDQDSASTIAQMGIATEEEEIEEQVTTAQDNKIAELLEEHETKNSQPKPKIKLEKTESQQPQELPVKQPVKKPKVDIAGSSKVTYATDPSKAKSRPAEKSKAAAKTMVPKQLPWSYDINEGTCDYDLAFRSEFQVFNIQHHEYMERLSKEDIDQARVGWKAHLISIKEPSVKFNGRGVVYSGYV